jgi:predicted MFS family arabinose efflux permease
METYMDGNPDKNYENKLLVILFFTVGFVFFDRLSINFLFPFMRAEFALTNSQIGLLTSALAVTWAISGVVLASFAENLNKRKPILIVTVIVFSFCSIGSGFATTFIGLLAARAVMGLAEGPVLPISQTLMGFASTESRRGFNMGFVQASAAGLLGAVLAPMVVIPLATHYGWRVAFFAAGIPGLIIALVLFKMVVEPGRQSSAAQHAAGSLAVAGENKPGSFRHLLGNRNLVLCLLISCLFITWFIALTTFAPLYLMESRGFSAAEMGMLMTVLGLSSVFGGFLVPGLSDRIGRRPTMIIFSMLAVTVPLVLVYAQVSLPVLAILLFLSYFGFGVFPLFISTIPAESVGIAHAGKAISLVIGVGEVVGGCFAPLLEGYAADRFGAHAPFLIASAATAVAVLLSFGLRETAPAKLRKSAVAGPSVKQGLEV